jgi:hypothetical protein
MSEVASTSAQLDEITESTIKFFMDSVLKYIDDSKDEPGRVLLHTLTNLTSNVILNFIDADQSPSDRLKDCVIMNNTVKDVTAYNLRMILMPKGNGH